MFPWKTIPVSGDVMPRQKNIPRKPSRGEPKRHNRHDFGETGRPGNQPFNTGAVPLKPFLTGFWDFREMV